MKALIDTNIVLDVLLNRQPYCQEAAKIIVLSEKKIIESYVSASAITDIFYITQKEYKNKQVTIDLIKKILAVISVATITGNNIYQALDLGWNDFEDSVQYIVGESISADYIITRNVDDFDNSTIKIVTPEQFLNILSEE
ncbi:MAG: PIN domain-containing protein [Treponema sp.]|jgi:predicted nucleic acid-binding protein|nr:PIN domain-containing protein [Treponema sp.]